MGKIAAVLAVPALTAILGAAVPVFACFGNIIEVVQPLVDPEGVHIRSVSFSRNCVPTLRVPGYEVSFVGEPSCVCRDDPPGGTANMNAASFLGIKTSIDPFHGRTSRLLGDTLHVIVDLTALPPMTEELRRQLFDWSIDSVVRATVTSVLLTAYRHRRGISEPDSLGMDHSVYAEHVWLEIEGSEQYASLGGVFNADYLDSLSRSQW